MIPSRPVSWILVAATLIAGCSRGSGALPALQETPPLRANASSGKYIQHIVVLVQENRSFDDLFATFPNADGATYGYECINGKSKKIALKMQNLAGALDVKHNYATFWTDYDGGKMDCFNESSINGGPKAGAYPYQYVNPAQIKSYWDLAQQYGLADYMFQTQGSGSFTAHQDLIAGATAVTFGSLSGSLIDWPNSNVWGCNAQPGTTTPMTQWNGTYPIPIYSPGPFPCLTYSTGTLRDLLDKQTVSWKYYAPQYTPNTAGTHWNAFAAIDAVYNGPEWKTNISMPQKNVIKDVENNALPAVSWVIPDQPHSDHPGGKGTPDEGPSWVAAVVNAIGKSSYWNSSAIIVVWDDWGGFYDHEKPAFFDQAGGLGFRVPMIVVSPYIRAGTISHTQYEFGGILKFVEETFNLGSLGTTDQRATSIGDMFNFKQKPRPFRLIQSALSIDQVMRQPESALPIDSE